MRGRILKTGNISFTAFKAFWTIVVTAGIFAATLYTTQSVSNTKISFLEREVVNLKSEISGLARSIDEVEHSQSLALADIAQKLHAMELQLKELQVTLFILVDENRSHSVNVENRLTPSPK